MNATVPTYRPAYRLTVTLIAVAILLLTACQPALVTPSPQPVQPSATAPAAAQPTEAPQPTALAADSLPTLTLDTSSGLAGSVTTETLEAVPASDDKPYWQVGPRTLRLTLQDYPVNGHMHKPQVFVYPVAELAAAIEAAGGIATDLQTLLQTQQVGDHLPFLPLFNAAQVMHAQVQFLDFKGGKGVRYLTQYDQGILPLNNYELLYTFQGLTNDGKYYVAVVLPITHPDLPATDKVSSEQMQELSDFPAYLSKTVEMLNQQPASAFTPDLAQLDAMIQSIEVK